MDQASNRHFFGVDFLRGISAVAVLFWHYQHFYYTSAGVSGLVDRSVQPFFAHFSLFYTRGGDAVQLFWTISGFVFAAVYASSAEMNAAGFIGNRFARLYPLHALTLLLVLALQIASLNLVGHYQIYPFNDLYHFCLNVFFASWWGLQKGYSFNAPIWSVSIEILVYFVFMLLMRQLLKWNILAPALASLSFVAWHKGLPLSDFWMCSTFFFSGATIFYLSKLTRHNPSVSFSILIILIVTCWLLPKTLYLWRGTDYQIRFILTCCALVLAFSYAEGLSYLRLAFQRARLMGDLTYATYLLHVPLQITILTVIEFFAIDRNVVSSNSFFIVFLATLFFISYASFRFFETPARIYLRKALSH
jgi:peptidoglycan/LPS O-acetylase OafA/YrhL